MAFEIKDCVVVHSTVTYAVRDVIADGGALLVSAPFFPDGEAWVPYNCVHEDSEVYRKGDHGTLLVKDWWAEKKGWL